MYRFLMAAIAIAVPSVAASAPRPGSSHPKVSLSAEGNRCLATGEAAQGNISAMEECISAEYDKQDARLNVVYKQAMARLTASQKSDLRKSERQWLLNLPAKVKRCTYPWGEDGREYGFVSTHCQTLFVIERTEWLRKHYPTGT